MSPFNQLCYRPLITSSIHPTQQNYEDMDTQLNLDDFIDLSSSTWTHIYEVLQTDATQSTTLSYKIPQVDP